MIDFISKVKCQSCSKEIDVDFHNFITGTRSYERQMGNEIQYEIECNFVTCTNCGNTFSVEGSIWEYPEECVNLVDVNPKS